MEERNGYKLRVYNYAVPEMVNVPNYLLRVSCMTFNQASYIEDAMNGFVMQQTNFPFVCTIVDDASTDGEQEIINKYMQEHFDLQDSFVAYDKEMDYGHVTFAQHKTNKNCYFAAIYLKENHYSQKKSKALYLTEWMDTKYVALCEGDDYWTDPMKLQKQVDFLEEHPDYSLCCHRFKMYYENTDTWSDDFGGETFVANLNVKGIEVTNSENFKTRFTWTLTLCYRKSVADKIVWPPYKFGHRDFNFHYHLLKEGKGWCFTDYMGVYRKHDGGIWSRLSYLDGAKIRLECYEDLYFYNHSDKVIRECYVYWLDCFYREFVLPPFLRHKVTRTGMKNLWFYCKHCRKVRSPFMAFKKCLKCFGAFTSVINV